MSTSVEQRLHRLVQGNLERALAGGLIGLEKETLRVAPDGSISHKPHPVALGSALTHPNITTDYSEALLEFITPPQRDLRDAHRFLLDIERFVYDRLEDEILWATSMPCVLAGDDSIPIAYYGGSNPGQMKHVYRRGLGYRYGRVMQVIAGVHFNYSLPDDFWPAWRELTGATGEERRLRDELYFDLTRNLLRHGWLIPYLFGASPAVCNSFLIGKRHQLQSYNESTAYMPYATSLRISDIGYQNRKESKAGIYAGYNSLEEYVASLRHGITTPYPEYEKLGVVVDGEWRQLNANILQIENEHYASVRPKPRVVEADPEERPSLALERRGVHYVELRSLDVCAFEPAGVNSPQLHFLEAFMLYCALKPSPAFDRQSRAAVDENLQAAAIRGREPGLELHRNGSGVALRDWALEVIDGMAGIAELLDRQRDSNAYRQSLTHCRELVIDPEHTPSARILAEMDEFGEGFYHFALRQSLRHHRFFQHLPLTAELEQRFRREAEQSLRRQQALEQAPAEPFADYLQRYFAQT